MRNLLTILLLCMTSFVHGQTSKVPKTSRVELAIGTLDTPVSAANPLPTLPADNQLERSRGLIDGQLVIRKFGSNPSIGTTAEVISTLSSTTYGGFLQAATTVRIKAGGNAADTAAGLGARSIAVSGLDSNWNVATETIATAGGSASSATSTSFIRVNRAWVTDVGTYHGSNTGPIVVENSSGGTDLVQIGAGLGQTEIAVYTIPAGYTGWLRGARWMIEGSKTITLLGLQNRNADDVTTPFTGYREVFRYPGLVGAGSTAFTGYTELPAKTDFWMTGTAALGTGAATAIFEITLVKD